MNDVPGTGDDVWLQVQERCALCLISFVPGDDFKAVYPLKSGLDLTATFHKTCYAQLAPGDLTLIFAALRTSLFAPLAELRRLHGLGLL